MELVSEVLKSPASVLRTLLSILVHMSISMIGVGVFSNVLVFLLFKLSYSFYPSVTIEHLRWTLTGIHGFPVQAAIGLLLGFVLAKYMCRRVMVWIWLLPLAFLCIGIVFLPRNGSSIWDHFFGSGCTPAGHCFDQLALTLPLVASAAYSLGAKLRINSPK
jgi:hypothetical protein